MKHVVVQPVMTHGDPDGYIVDEVYPFDQEHLADDHAESCGEGAFVETWSDWRAEKHADGAKFHLL